MSPTDQERPAVPGRDDLTDPPGSTGRRTRFGVGMVIALALVIVSSSGGLPLNADPLPDLVDGIAAVLEPGDPRGDASPPSSPDPAATVRPSTAPRTPMPEVSHPAIPPRTSDDYLLMTRTELLALPTSGPAWDALRAIADAPLGRPDLTDQDERHGVHTLAVALVYARTGASSYGERAREAITGAVGTERVGAGNSTLALGRQLGAYVLAADFIRLSGTDDERFRDWLTMIRTEELRGHGRWRSLTATHEDSANNWGAFAGASRIAASLYLDDVPDVERAAKVLRGFLGDRDAWKKFQPVDDSRAWACERARYTPVNPPCAKDGIDLDGAIVRDISRGGRLRWPPREPAIGYTLESLQGLIVQAELLYQNGFGDPWTWSDAAIRRAASLVTASGDAGGETWNRSAPSYHVPWLLNARYDLGLPTRPAGPGRVFGYTDWLYGD